VAHVDGAGARHNVEGMLGARPPALPFGAEYSASAVFMRCACVRAAKIKDDGAFKLRAGSHRISGVISATLLTGRHSRRGRA
jgi:hypothetical protein